MHGLCDNSLEYAALREQRKRRLGPYSLLVPGPGGWTQADQRQVRDGARPADVPRSLPAAPPHRAGRWLLRV